LRPQAPEPDLVIYLQAQPEILIERVRKRGLSMEAGISEMYLYRLCESYSRFFYHYDAAPLLIVNAENLNPIERDDDFALLLKRIDGMRGKREFFNLGE
jgi:deoxyadenosine/deoxycytidine kinase